MPNKRAGSDVADSPPQHAESDSDDSSSESDDENEDGVGNARHQFFSGG